MQKKALTVFPILCAAALLVFSPTSSAATTDPRMLLKRVQEKLKSAKSISYDIHCRFKFFDEDDTDTFDAHVDLLREPEDSINGCYLLVQLESNFMKYFGIKFYDTKNLYLLFPKDSSIEIFDIRKLGWNITHGNTADEVILQSFLDPSKLDYDSTVEITYLGDSIIRGSHILNTLSVKRKSEDGYEWFPYYTVIDPALDFGVYSRGIVKHQGKYQYKEAAYSNVEFDKVDSNYFNNFKLPEGCRVWHYEPKNPLDQKPLVNDIIAPDFTAKMYPDTTKTTKLSNYRGKIVVLDFWYMACPHCVQAFPALEEINKKYANKGVVVLGLNSLDLLIKRMPRLLIFFTYNPITYSTIFPERSVDEEYHVNAYPTMYIIDKNGKIAFSQVGYAPGDETVITDKLDAMLK